MPGETYHVTDVAKGAALAGEAPEHRLERWEKWYPLLVQEVDLVAKSDAKVLAVGKDPAQFLEGKGFKLSGTILSYSPTAARWRMAAAKDRAAEFQRFANSVAIADVMNVARAATTEAGIQEALRQEILKTTQRLVLVTQASDVHVQGPL